MNTDNTLTFHLKDQTFEMVFVSGTDENGFMMGGESWNDRSLPVHPVRLSSYWIGKYPVTQGLYEAVMGTNTSFFQGEVNRPVERVSWNEIMGESGNGSERGCFMFKLHEALRAHPENKEAIEKAAQILREEKEREAEKAKKEVSFKLPSEAQWEYAARGGQNNMGAEGKWLNDYEYSGSNEIHEVAWYGENSHNETKPVGLKKPNGLGLYDMSGNVWEWCMDTWHKNYDGAPSDGSAWVDGQSSYRVFRGGSWNGGRGDVRLTYRDYGTPAIRYGNLGFRLCLA